MKSFLKWMVPVVCLIAAVKADARSVSPRVQLETTKGVIVLELDSAAAPKTVANFMAYVEDGFYDNTIFHRVIQGFMIQGGGFTSGMQQKKTKSPIPNEADNGRKNVRGAVAMARTNDPHSATAQFFINVADNAFLDHKAKNPRGWGYCVFGRVVEGMDVVRAIEKVTTTRRAGHADVPAEPVVIKKATILPSPAAAEETENAKPGIDTRRDP